MKMNEKLKEIIDSNSEKFKLDNYTLKNHHIFREQTGMGKTSFILSMEWVPKEIKEWADDYNPPGTAIIDIDVHSRLLRRIVFVENENLTDADLPDASSTELAIEWVEQETGLTFGRQFKLIHEEEKELLFHAAVDNIAVFPSGTIQLEFNEAGKLSLFSIDGYFPDESQLDWEPFALTPDTILPIAQAHSKLLEIPLEEEGKWTAVYSAPTIFVTNDGKRTISFEEVESPKSYIEKDITLEWKAPLGSTFSMRKVDLSLEATEDEAFAGTVYDDNEVLTVEEQEKAEDATRKFLQNEFPEDSGKWRLSAIWRENGYIFAELKPAAPDARVIDRKIKLIVDSATFEPINYIDNSIILDMFQDFEQADKPVLSIEEAFSKLRPHIEITPVYVFDKKQDRYILCGKADCDYGIDAVTGSLILLDEL